MGRSPVRRAAGAGAFTLVEVMVAMAVLLVLMGLTVQLFNSTASVTSNSTKQMDSDADARALFDRMEIDFSKMLKRPDVDYYLRSPAHAMSGNTPLAFFCQVPGYNTSADSQSPVSLVAYRLNSATLRLERLGKGLLWNGSAETAPSLVFLPQTIDATWPVVASASAADPDWELVGPQIFRFEYHYVLKGSILADGTTYPALFSDTPWDIRLGHSAVNGLADVAALVCTLAVIDARSRRLLTTQQLQTLGNHLADFSGSSQTDDLSSKWQPVVAGSGLPSQALVGIRVYSRTFYLLPISS